MSYTIYPHTDLPAIICVLGAEFNLKADMDNVLQELHALLDQVGQPVYYINDISGAKMNFSDLVVGMGAAATAGGVLRHPNLYELIMLSASDVIRLGVTALGQSQYGGIKARFAKSLDEALTFVRHEVKATQ